MRPFLLLLSCLVLHATGLPKSTDQFQLPISTVQDLKSDEYAPYPAQYEFDPTDPRWKEYGNGGDLLIKDYDFYNDDDYEQEEEDKDLIYYSDSRYAPTSSGYYDLEPSEYDDDYYYDEDDDAYTTDEIDAYQPEDYESYDDSYDNEQDYYDYSSESSYPNDPYESASEEAWYRNPEGEYGYYEGSKNGDMVDYYRAYDKNIKPYGYDYYVNGDFDEYGGYGAREPPLSYSPYEDVYYDDKMFHPYPYGEEQYGGYAERKDLGYHHVEPEYPDYHGPGYEHRDVFDGYDFNDLDRYGKDESSVNYMPYGDRKQHKPDKLDESHFDKNYKFEPNYPKRKSKVNYDEYVPYVMDSMPAPYEGHDNFRTNERMENANWPMYDASEFANVNYENANDMGYIKPDDFYPVKTYEKEHNEVWNHGGRDWSAEKYDDFVETSTHSPMYSERNPYASKWHDVEQGGWNAGDDDFASGVHEEFKSHHKPFERVYPDDKGSRKRNTGKDDKNRKEKGHFEHVPEYDVHELSDNAHHLDNHAQHSNEMFESEHGWMPEEFEKQKSDNYAKMQDSIYSDHGSRAKKQVGKYRKRKKTKYSSKRRNELHGKLLSEDSELIRVDDEPKRINHNEKAMTPKPKYQLDHMDRETLKQKYNRQSHERNKEDLRITKEKMTRSYGGRSDEHKEKDDERVAAFDFLSDEKGGIDKELLRNENYYMKSGFEGEGKFAGYNAEEEGMKFEHVTSFHHSGSIDKYGQHKTNYGKYDTYGTIKKYGEQQSKKQHMIEGKLKAAGEADGSADTRDKGQRVSSVSFTSRGERHGRKNDRMRRARRDYRGYRRD